MHLSLTLLVVFSALLAAQVPDSSIPSHLETFKECLMFCSKVYGDCLKETNGMWKSYHTNVKNITKIVRRCCLRNEKKANAEEEDSFATCAMIRCGAHLYGCQVKKRHVGFLSSEEIQHILEKKNKSTTGNN
nr:unnamed protein product [Spirometra erinaceieuropaei]